MTKVDNRALTQLVVKVIKERKPTTVRQLISWLHKETLIPEYELFCFIQELEMADEIYFNELFFPQKSIEYVFSTRALWFWTMLTVSLLSVIVILSIPPDVLPFVYLRNILGIFFILFLPGYSLIKVLYPVRLPIVPYSVMLDTIERSIISLALSIVISSIIGFILYYTPWGLGFSQIVPSIFTVSIIFLVLAVIRDYTIRKSMFTRKIILISDYEISRNKLTFFRKKKFSGERLIVKTIPISEILNVQLSNFELSITGNEGTYIFFIVENPDLFQELVEKLRRIKV